MEEYGKFICLSEGAKEKLANMSEAELNIMASLIADSMNKIQSEIGNKIHLDMYDETVIHQAIDENRGNK